MASTSAQNCRCMRQTNGTRRSRRGAKVFSDRYSRCGAQTAGIHVERIDKDLRTSIRDISSRAAPSVEGSVGETVGSAMFGMSCSSGPREEMEDELCCIPNFGDALYTAVFDGHGGTEVAKWLNENLQDFVGPALKQSGNYEAALQAAFHAADAEILSFCRQVPGVEGEVSGAGATGTVVVVKQNEVITANIGDSSAVLQRGGRQVLLSREHRVYGKSKAAKAEIQRVKSAGGWVSYDGRVCDVLAVSRAFGDAEFKGEGLLTLLPDGVKAGFWTQKFADKQKFTSDPVIATPAVTYTEVSEEGDDEFIILASDGLWDFWEIPNVMNRARDALLLGASEEEVADILVEKALRRYTSDNVAVIVVTFPWTRQLLERKAAEAKAKRKSRKGKFMGVF